MPIKYNYAIESDVPISSYGGSYQGTLYTTFPFARMRQGDSFFVELDDDPVLREREYQRLAKAITKASGKYGSFTRRTVEGGVRVWKIS